MAAWFHCSALESGSKPIHEEPLNNRLPDTLISNSDKPTNYPLSFPASLESKVTSFNPALSTFTFTFTSSQTPFPLNFHNRPTLPLNLSPLPPPLPSLLTNPFTVINPAFLRSRDPLPLHPIAVHYIQWAEEDGFLCACEAGRCGRIVSGHRAAW